MDEDPIEALSEAGRPAVLGEVCGLFAHELSQPLAACRNYVETVGAVLEGSPIAPRSAESAGLWLREASRQLDRSLQILERLRSVMHAPVEALRETSVAEVLDAACADERPAIAAAGVRLDMQVAPSSLRALVEASRVQLAVAELVANALRAVRGLPPAERTVEVAAARLGSRVEIVVADGGLTVSDELLERMNEPFFSTRPKKFGLGLSIVRSVAHGHGGALCIERRVPQGLRFRLQLRQPD
jgi:C4-dicarboxylate-specific signal transduction histidine kinase